MLNETQGSIDNELQFLQFANAANAAVAQVLNTQQYNQTDINIQLTMQTITALYNHLLTLNPSPSTSISFANNPNAFTIWTILTTTLTNATPGGSIQALCAMSTLAAPSVDNINYLLNSGFSDFTTRMYITKTSALSLQEGLSNIDGAHLALEMCNTRIQQDLGWYSWQNWSNESSLDNDLFNNLDNYLNSRGKTIGTGTSLANIATSILAINSDLSGAKDGYLSILNLFITTRIGPTQTSALTSDLVTLAGVANSPDYVELGDALLGNSDPNGDDYTGYGVGTAFLNMLDFCISAEYGNAGSPINAPNGHCVEPQAKERGQWYLDSGACSGWNPKSPLCTG